MVLGGFTLLLKKTKLWTIYYADLENYAKAEIQQEIRKENITKSQALDVRKSLKQLENVNSNYINLILFY